MFGSRKLYKNKRNSFLKLKFYPKYLYFGKTFPHMICKVFLLRGVCDIFMSFPHISLIYHLLDVTLFSFQGTIFKNMFILRRTSFFFLGSPGKAVGFFGEKEEQGGGFTNSRLADLLSSRLCSDVVEMRRIELLTPCLQGRCSPS